MRSGLVFYLYLSSGLPSHMLYRKQVEAQGRRPGEETSLQERVVLLGRDGWQTRQTPSGRRLLTQASPETVLTKLLEFQLTPQPWPLEQCRLRFP